MLENPVTDIFEAAGTGLEVASMWTFFDLRIRGDWLERMNSKGRERR
jgi:hypothetical protein